MRRVEERVLRFQICRVDDFFAVVARRENNFIIRIVMGLNRINMAVAVAVGHSPADRHIMAVIPFLLALIFRHTVIVLLDDLMGQVLEMRRFKRYAARIGMIAQNIRRNRILTAQNAVPGWQ